MRQLVRWRAASLAVLLVASVGCGGGAAPDAGGGGPTEPPAPPGDVIRVPLPDGRFAARLCGVDVAARTVDVDLVVWLTGSAARRIWAGEHPDDPLGPPNDYLVVDADPTLWREPVGPGVEVRLVRLAEDSDADLDPGTFEELPGYLAAQTSEGPCAHPPYWVTVADGTVVGIEEQYVP